ATSLDGARRIYIRDGRKTIFPNMDPRRLPWYLRARELTDWVRARMVTRTDIWGSYYFSRRTGEVETMTSPRKADRDKGLVLTDDLIFRHFRATGTTGIIGVHSTAWAPDGCRSLWGGTDIDAHDETDDPEANWQAALHWHRRLIDLGFHP